MTNTLYDISNKIDAAIKEILISVNNKAQECGVDYLVVGAAARDIIFHSIHGIEIQLATEDYDFGICISDWSDFERLRQSLIQVGWHKDRNVAHRLNSPEGYMIDLVPFGPIESPKGDILWPPDGSIVMNVMGFKEAHKNAIIIRVSQSPNIDIPIASPGALMLLKTVAWLDRAHDLRQKDAKDIFFMLSNFQYIPGHIESLYDANMMASFNYDINLASAHAQGLHVRSIADEETLTFIEQGMNEQAREALTLSMCSHPAEQFVDRRRLVDIFLGALLNETAQD